MLTVEPIKRTLVSGSADGEVLISMGLLRARRGSGTYITDGPPALVSEPLALLAALHGFTLNEIFEARRSLESLLAGMAAERATGDQLVEMAEVLANMYEAVCAVDHPRARQQTFNICMDEPVDYGELATYLAETRGLPAVPVRTAYRSTWLDNTKAKFLLGWRPEYDLRKMIDAAWDYRRTGNDPRIVWYPG
jgi:hypothetical protein